MINKKLIIIIVRVFLHIIAFSSLSFGIAVLHALLNNSDTQLMFFDRSLSRFFLIDISFIMIVVPTLIEFAMTFKPMLIAIIKECKKCKVR